MKERKIILSDEVHGDDFKDGAAEAGWELVAEHPQSETSTYEQIYRAGSARATTLHYIEDQFVKVRYALARGPEAEAVVEEVTEFFAHGPDDRVLIAAEDEEQGPQYKVDWLMSATVLGDQLGHERLASLIERRLAEDNPGVRKAALMAASWLEWPDFRPTVERMAREDPDEAVRSDAAKLAGAYALRDEGKL